MIFVYFGASICALTLDIERWICFGALRRTDIVMEMKIRGELNQAESSCFSRFLPNIAEYLYHVIYDTIKYRDLKRIFWGWDVSCNLWHNHPFDLVWFYAHTICIFYQNCIRIYHFQDTYMYNIHCTLYVFILTKYI